MEKKLTVDRLEEGIAVCFDEDGNKYEIKESLCEGDIFIADIGYDGKLTLIRKNDEETLKTKARNASRLEALFVRGDKRK